MSKETDLLRRAAEMLREHYNLKSEVAEKLLALADQMERAEPDCWAILTPNGSRLVSEAEAKGKMKPYPLYTHPAPEVTRDAEPVATLHDDGHWTWKPGHVESMAERQAGWRMDVYTHPALAWRRAEDMPREGQKVTVAFDWEGDLQLAAGTFHDGQFFQDGGDMESEIHGVQFWCEHSDPRLPGGGAWIDYFAMPEPKP